MTVDLNAAAVGQTKWHEYAVRFLFGGLITAVTGVIAKEFGPGIGGLFLAFPAIFPASATLIEKHAKQKKQRAGLDGTKRARGAASLDADGAARGSIGLMAFALLVWWFIPDGNAYLVLAGSALVWFALSIAMWRLRKMRFRFFSRGSILPRL